MLASELNMPQVTLKRMCVVEYKQFMTTYKLPHTCNQILLGIRNAREDTQYIVQGSYEYTLYT